MKRKYLCLLSAVLLLLCTAACKKAEEAPAEPTPALTPEPAIVVVDEMPVHSDSWEDILNEEVPPPEAEPGALSATTGREVDAGHPFRPVFVCYDNAALNRPLSGIAEADIVYEMPASDGGGTRLLALFNDLSPAQVGPLAGMDAGFAGVQKEWGGLLVDAEAPANKEYVFTPEDAEGTFADLNRLVPALFTMEPPEAAIRFLLSEGYPYENAAAAGKFRLGFGGGAETVEYAFDSKTRTYQRFQANADGRMTASAALSYNEESAALESVPLSINSVIVQYVEFAAGAPKLTGSGKCDYFVGGVRVSGTWERAAETDATMYYLEDGSVVTLESGRTWIALHPADKPAQLF